MSRGTVAFAYDRLASEGFVTSRVGAGTFVSQCIARTEPAVSAADGVLRPRPVWDQIPDSPAFAAPARYEFRTGLPDASRFPFGTWRQLMARELRASAVGRGEYGDQAGTRRCAPQSPAMPQSPAPSQSHPGRSRSPLAPSKPST